MSHVSQRIGKVGAHQWAETLHVFEKIYKNLRIDPEEGIKSLLRHDGAKVAEEMIKLQIQEGKLKILPLLEFVNSTTLAPCVETATDEILSVCGTSRRRPYVVGKQGLKRIYPKTTGGEIFSYMLIEHPNGKTTMTIQELIEELGGEKAVRDYHLFTPSEIRQLIDAQPDGREDGFIKSPSSMHHHHFFIEGEQGVLYLAEVMFASDHDYWVIFFSHTSYVTYFQRKEFSNKERFGWFEKIVLRKKLE